MARRNKDQQGDGHETGGGPKGGRGPKRTDADRDIERPARAGPGRRDQRPGDRGPADSRGSGGTSDSDDLADSGTGGIDGAADLEGSNYGGYGASDGYSVAAADQTDLNGGRKGTGRSGDANYDVDEKEDEEQGQRRGGMGAIETSRPESPGTTSDPDDMSGTQGTSGSSGNLGDPASYGPGSGRDEGRFP